MGGSEGSRPEAQQAPWSVAFFCSFTQSGQSSFRSGKRHREAPLPLCGCLQSIHSPRASQPWLLRQGCLYQQGTLQKPSRLIQKGNVETPFPLLVSHAHSEHLKVYGTHFLRQLLQCPGPGLRGLEKLRIRQARNFIFSCPSHTCRFCILPLSWDSAPSPLTGTQSSHQHSTAGKGSDFPQSHLGINLSPSITAPRNTYPLNLL